MTFVLKISSPEEGRDNEAFQFHTRGHKKRPKDKPPKPAFAVAERVP